MSHEKHPSERTPVDDAIDIGHALQRLLGPADADPPDPWELVSALRSAGQADPDNGLLPSVEELVAIANYLKRAAMAIAAPDREAWLQAGGGQTYYQRRHEESLTSWADVPPVA